MAKLNTEKKFKIPFNRPTLAGKEIEYIVKSVKSGHAAGDGLFTKKCHLFFERRFAARKVLLTSSCTAALEMAAILFDIQPGDEVILPSFTFVSTANAFYMRGAKLVFADIRPDTLNLDESKLKGLISNRTKVIIPVHYAGVACEMDEIMKIARQSKAYVVEDAAQGVNAKYKNKYLGTIADLGTYSFHETKNYICGEGGAIVINNDKFIERAEIIREKGTNRSKFFRGEVDKYTWVDIGSSYLPSDILAAYLYAQLEKMDEIDKCRKKIFDSYLIGLRPLEEKGYLRLPYVPTYCKSNSHLFYILLNNSKTRDSLMNYLKSKGILAIFHYLPLHLSKVGAAIGYKKGNFPVTESASERLLRLPFYNEMKSNDQQKIINFIQTFFKSKL
ncbi:MAG: dTDP-4-amino-4,6-dideoxygalactose transaminase [Candidatus Omnitrophica bacterium]|nr:dTDP-4-amino-4,6-dideoxygalactose transaminase [Candidatus Omnitrophota bacterium]